ncbi:hypothetical protein SLE2022_220960 [Rubroshorea leprosula]|uniref:Transmembrane protein n=1 Tax=Rubroshorea leprosula TaxID=152421 RepID=A0AAV5KXJ5_9ROSI|nr:hypothetical protein SLEP1_g38204 [Rubroshorea leprosula]
MGLSINGSSTSSVPQSHRRTHKIFLLSNYILLGAASSCVFLTLSLRLIPSLCGFFFILLNVVAIVAAICGCSVVTTGSNKRYAAHMVATVLTSICQGSVSVLILTRTADFLGYLKSYVREDDGVVILKLVGGLCVVVFCMEWVVLTLGFLVRYYAFVEGSEQRIAGAGAREEDLKNWPWPFQVQV